MANTQATRILTDKQIRQKIERIAFEIYEENHAYEEIAFVGVAPTGYHLAEALSGEYKKISRQAVGLYEIEVDKQAPVCGDVQLKAAPELLSNRPVVLVDDVLNTGRTLIYALRPFYRIAIPKLQIAVLVYRDHKLFPVVPDFVGLSLSTTLQNHVEVKKEGSLWACYLY
ncbi:MAG: phosphoribosyltransferase [Thermonema sp.]|jgi:pyrimidine operon attenuation protein/uracil phosphoribosyltransferase|uniref:phosphoribosyltransferase family protein n=1 Tax=Thermonema sp. TaxID=2231181 RepID=UPI0021DC2187|nr:phosphoribosyltransferase family protein [Thermonema sp.]GIV39651.1 MAG: phosphoribosyltransferase [Thermonema sp.]